MGALGKLLMSIAKLTGIKAIEDFAKPFIDMDNQKKRIEREIAQKKSQAQAVKKNFQDLAPKKKVP